MFVVIATLVLTYVMRRRQAGRVRVQLASLTVFSTLALAIVGTDPLLIRLLNALLTWAKIQPIEGASLLERVLLLTIVWGVLVAFNWIWERSQIVASATNAQPDVQSPLPAKDYYTLRDAFCDFMTRELDGIDRDLDWSDAQYTTLQAEVEIERQGRLRRRTVGDVLKAIRSDRESRAFLVIGDPGAGKSVSLRRLCRALYQDVADTGVVPVYVNLREWQGVDEPSETDIEHFILAYLQNQSGRVGRTFLESYYRSMLEAGKFFFILDSFDEMPSVLDSDDSSAKLHRISEAFDRFFFDLHQCRGILASRPFRQPVGFRGRKLIIRPFQERQVRLAMTRWLLGQQLNAKQIVMRLFSERPELAPAVRNPFTAELIAQYVLRHSGDLPTSYFEIFESYVQTRLENERRYLLEKNLTPEQLIEFATDMAWAMYKFSQCWA
jgi:hypothetical protein